MSSLRSLWLPLLLASVLGVGGCFQGPSNGAGQSSTDVAPTSQRQSSPQSAGSIAAGEDNSNLLLGNPSRAGKEPNNFLLVRPQHAMSYNRKDGGPNWVSWHLEKSDLGSVRRGDFLPDPMLPADWQIRPSDYRGSGYDRGHICPSGDRTRTKADNTATFVMSNMLPQAAALNQQVWKDLEEYERSLTNTSELYIIAGGIGSAERIAGGKVNVPSVCWKILVILPRGDNDLSRINASTRVIAVSMPNRERQEIADSKWQQWITSVAQLEKTTGYDFLSALPDDIERALEEKVDASRTRVSSRLSRLAAADSQVTAPTPNTVISPDAARVAEEEAFRAGRSDGRSIEQSRTRVVQRAVTQRAVTTQRTQDFDTQTRVENFQSPSDAPVGQATDTQTSAATDGQVWVNTNSGIYHYPGTRWYGNTKNGEYMSEAQARAMGHRAALNGQ